jgi:nitrite reductase (NADH) small subunit
MSDTQRWVRTARCEEIPLREGRSVRLADRDIAIFNLGDRFLAVENRCPHKGGPLSEGIVSGATVVCPLHTWKVSLETGNVVSPADNLACVKAFRTSVEAGVILIDLPAESAEGQINVLCDERSRSTPWTAPLPSADTGAAKSCR